LDPHIILIALSSRIVLGGEKAWLSL